MKMGALDSMSIGYIPTKYDIDNESGVRSLTEVKLYEVSVVPFPMNEQAKITAVKSIEEQIGLLDEDKQKQVKEFIKGINNINSSLDDSTHDASQVVLDDQPDTKTNNSHEDHSELLHLLDITINTIKGSK